MKKIFLTILAILCLHGIGRAGLIEWQYIPRSSYTEVPTNGGAILFSSAPIQFVGVTVSSPSSGSSVTIFRSTEDAFSNLIASQVHINTDYFTNYSPSTFIPLFNLKNTSYTYINKIGTAKVIYWFNCVGETNLGVCPGMSPSGQKE